MGTHWVTIAKIAGPLVTQLQQLFFSWVTTSRDNKAGIQEPSLHAAMLHDTQRLRAFTNLIAAIDANATTPPIVAYCRILDSWTVTPSLVFASECALHSSLSILIRS